MKRISLLLLTFASTAQAAAKPAPDSGVEKHSTSMASKNTPATPIGDPAEWVTSDDYPAEAMRSGSTGAVNFTLAIDETGKVTDCSVTETSGNQTLDDATCALMMARASFTPARDKKGQPIAATFHRKIRWQLPGAAREIWTLDQIRFPTPKNAQLASFAGDHSMDAVVKRLNTLGIAFERSAAQLDTVTLPEPTMTQINGLPPAEPFVIPQAGITKISVITARKQIDFNGTAAKPVPLESSLATRATISYDVDPDGMPINCQVDGEAPVWMPAETVLCRAMEEHKPVFSADPTKRTRHVAITLQVSVKSSDPSSAPPPAK